MIAVLDTAHAAQKLETIAAAVHFRPILINPTLQSKLEVFAMLSEREQKGAKMSQVASVSLYVRVSSMQVAQQLSRSVWGFPEIGVPPNHPF